MNDEKTGVILDVDGTLIDSNGFHAQSWADAFAEAGYHFGYARIRPLIGKGGDKMLDELVGLDEESPEGRALAQRRAAIFAERYLCRIKPFPETRALVQKLKAHGYAVVIASSSERDQLEELLDRAHVKDLVGSSTSSSDAERSKPDPDIVEAARKKLGVEGAKLFMLGDTPYDIEAAQKAGIETIALSCGGWADEQLAAAVAIYDNPEDLLHRFAESPLGRRAPHRVA